MNITLFSIFTSFLWLSLFMVITIFVSRKISAIKYFSLWGMIFLVILSLVRIFIPHELPFTIEINSTKIMPVLYRLWRLPLITIHNISITLHHILISISILVSVILFMRLVVKNKQVYKSIRYMDAVTDNNIINTLEKTKQLFDIKKEIGLVSCDLVNSPMIIGLSKPVIILPQITFSDTQIEGVLIHELAHYKYKHIVLIFIVEIINIIFWWNPLAYLFKNAVGNLIEFHADEKVCLLLDKIHQKNYLTAISMVVEAASEQKYSKYSECAVSLSEAESQKTIIQRFNLVINNVYSYNNTKLRTIFCTLVTALMILSYAFVVQPYHEPSYEDYHDNASFIVPGSYIMMNDDNTYTIYSPKGEEIATHECPILESHRYLEIRK